MGGHMGKKQRFSPVRVNAGIGRLSSVSRVFLYPLIGKRVQAGLFAVPWYGDSLLKTGETSGEGQ